MKYLIITLLFLFSCNSYNSITKEEYNKFLIKGDTIFYDEFPVGIFSSAELEYYRGHKTIEISIDRIPPIGIDDMSGKILDFLRNRHPKAKIEVKSNKVR